jgi:Restriction endonuclease
MADFDFKQLSPHDFELLVRDLLQVRDEIQLESFKTGRDNGIDFRHAKGTSTIIVQCKHYRGTGIDGLLRDLKKEAVKAKRLNPSRYIIATSVPLSPANKSDIIALFAGIIVNSSDVVGPDDLNNLLDQHPAILGQHYKLWLGSRAVLDRVIHNASITQSEFDVQRVHDDIARYVQSAAYPRAIDMLNESHVAIISGAPGVGKTTLARMLLYAFLEQGFEVVSILTDFQSGHERYQPGKKQIFYFDDFIGATFLGERASAFTRNEDRAILDFIEMVRLSKTARLIMTTREHILQQAISASEKLKSSRLVDSKCVLEIGDYTQRQRGEILYNHIYFSELPQPYRDELLSGRFYLDIIKHQKFNPRLIEWLSDFHRVRTVVPPEYKQFVRNLLADPADIWRHAYQEQISDAARSILLALYSHGGDCHPATLEKAFWALHKRRAANYGFKSDPADWRRGLSELHGSFIRPGDTISVIDPSVLDMLNAVMREDTRNALDVIEGATRFDQARQIWKVAKQAANQPVLSFLHGEHQRVEIAFTRLLDAPDRKPFGSGVAFIDDSHTERLALLIDLATAFQLNGLITVIHQRLTALLLSWKTEHFGIDEALTLAERVNDSTYVFVQNRQAFHRQIMAALCKQAAMGCWSNELRAILDAIPDEELTPEMKSDLAVAANRYRTLRQSEEVRELKSEGDFETVAEDLAEISERLGIDMTASITEVEEAKAEFAEHQSAYEDSQYDQWKEARYFERSSEQDLDDLFDSLRP